MSRIWAALVIAALGICSAIAAETTPQIVPFRGGEYMIYGGDLGDVSAPKPGDAKLYVELSGEPARGIFQQLGRASEKKQCVEPGEVFRRKGDVACTRARDNTYTCQMGFNLSTGKSANATIC